MTPSKQAVDEGPERIVDEPVASVRTLPAVSNLVKLSTGDNVGIALRDIQAGELARTAEGTEIMAVERIPLGHKLALRPIAAGEKIIRLGVAVGIATKAIGAGCLVHVHNVRSQYLDNAEDHYE